VSRLVSTGGTARSIADAGLAVRDVSELTAISRNHGRPGQDAASKVHGGLLAIRDDEAHRAAMEAHGIGAIDLAVVNLYPFEAVRVAGGD
jgi:phosphoribosylaminoimidazolecarboxamide formyltransferase / IMP cyclohydrolase